MVCSAKPDDPLTKPSFSLFPENLNFSLKKVWKLMRQYVLKNLSSGDYGFFMDVFSLKGFS